MGSEQALPDNGGREQALALLGLVISGPVAEAIGPVEQAMRAVLAGVPASAG